MTVFLCGVITGVFAAVTAWAIVEVKSVENWKR